jgi:hypothetical protein
MTEAMPMTTDATEKFKAIVMLANRVACGFNEGDLDTCILTSYALAAALTDLGYADARPVRVEAASFPDDWKLPGVVLGHLGSPGSGRRRRVGDDIWWGQLAVCIGQSWLLDPTLDQLTTTTAPNGLMLELASSRWQRPSHLNFGTSICSRLSVCCGWISLP